MKPDPTKPKKAGYVPAFFDPLFLFLRIRVDLIPEFVLESEKIVGRYVEVFGNGAQQFQRRIAGAFFQIGNGLFRNVQASREFRLAQLVNLN